jgi:5'-3' exonuclease
MKALIDGDILLYRVGFTTQEETESIAKVRMDELVSRILDTVSASEYVVYLSCGRKDSFRAKLNPEYKANRTQPKPLHYEILKQHLINNWNAVVAVEEEADDLIGIEQASNPDTIACTNDKDILYGVEGHKYNFVKETIFYTPKEEATVFFYKQLLMGDKADNIFGIAGVGEKKAENALSPYYEEGEPMLFKVVQDRYREWLKDLWADSYIKWSDFQEKQMNNLILLSGIQLKIRSYPNEIWKFPVDVEPNVSPVLGEVNEGVDRRAA